MPLWVQVPTPEAWLVMDIGHFPPSRLFVLLSSKSKLQVLIAMVLRSHYSQFLLFSESSTPSAIVDDVAKFLESLCNSSESCISQHSNFGAAGLSWTRRDKSLMRNASTAITARWVKIIVDFSVLKKSNRSCNLRNWSLNRLTVRESWSCCVGISPNLRFFLFEKILPHSSVFSILQFLGNFLRCVFDEDGLSSPIPYANTLSLSLICLLNISSKNCSLWDPSSRRNSNNAYSEFLRSIFWISMSYSVEYNFFWTEISPRVAFRALRWRCSRRSHPSE